MPHQQATATWKHGRLTKTEAPYGVNLIVKIFALRVLEGRSSFDEIVYCFWIAYGADAIASLSMDEAKTLPAKLRSEYATEMRAALAKVAAGSS